MKTTHYCLLIAVLLVSIAANFTGIGWGLPGARRTGLVFPADLRNDAFNRKMVETRDRIYEITEGSPVGLARTGDPGLSPIKQSLGITEGANVISFKRNDTALLSNLIRPYLLRSNHTDEQMIIAALSKINPKKLKFDPKLYHYGGAYIYPAGAWIFGSSVLGLTKLSPDITYYFGKPEEMAKVFIAGRCLSAVSVVLSVLLVFLIGKRLFSARAGLIAAFIFAITPAAIIQAHTMKPYALALLYSLLCVYSCTFMENSGKKSLFFGGIFAGLATGSLYPYWLVSIIPASFMLFYRRPARELAFFALGGILSFAASNPYWIISSREVFQELASGKTSYPFSFSLMQTLGTLKNLLVIGAREGAVLVFLCGLAYTAAKREKRLLAVAAPAAVIIPFFSLIMTGFGDDILTSRFLLPWYALLAVAGAAFFDAALSTKYKALFAALLVLCSLQTLNYSAAYTANFSIDSTPASTRLEAGRYIAQNIPAGSSIGLEEMPEPSHVPPFNFRDYRISVISKPGLLKRSQLPEYYIVKFDNPETRAVMAGSYRLEKSFAPRNPFFAVFGDNEVTNANTAFRIFRKTE